MPGSADTAVMHDVRSHLDFFRFEIVCQDRPLKMKLESIPDFSVQKCTQLATRFLAGDSGTFFLWRFSALPLWPRFVALIPTAGIERVLQLRGRYAKSSRQKHSVLMQLFQTSAYKLPFESELITALAGRFGRIDISDAPSQRCDHARVVAFRREPFMANRDLLKKGQEVFLKRPLQIYATVIGPADFGSGDSQVYCLKLQPQTQYYRSDDLELSENPRLKTAARRDFFERAQELNGRIARRAYELFESRGSSHGHDLEDWMNAQAEIIRNVPVDIRESEDDLTIHAEVPGFTEESLEIQVEPLSLCIASYRQDASRQDEGALVYSERHANPIFRVIDLPSAVDPQSVALTLSDGVLEIRVSKVASGQEIDARAKGAAA